MVGGDWILWMNSMVYGRYNELVHDFMGVISLFTNQLLYGAYNQLSLIKPNGVIMVLMRDNPKNYMES